MTDWADIAPPSAGLCTRCRQREAATIIRLFAQERGKRTSASSSQAGKTLAGRAVRLCDPCAQEVFAWTLARLEEASAAVRLPDLAMRDALAYAVAYLEADEDGRELNEGLDLGYLRTVLGK